MDFSAPETHRTINFGERPLKTLPRRTLQGAPKFGLSNLARAVAIAILLIAQGAAEPIRAQGGPQPVIVAQAVQEEIVDRLEALGTLRANEQVTITAQVTEIITELKFEDGQRVAKGDTLAVMTSAEETAQLQEAEATVREAADQLERTKPLAKRGVSSDALLSERRRDYETAVARLEAVKSRIADRRIEAPFDGVLGLRMISVGALVEPGTVITTIDDDSVMKLDFNIPATFLSTMRVGLPIEALAEAFGSRTFEGTISGVDSRVDAVTRSVTVRAVIPNNDGVLKGGLLMTVEVLKNKRQAVVIPEQAVIARGRETSVFVVDPKAESQTAQARKVELGTRRNGRVEVISGLSAGEHVVTDGTLRVKTGQAVTIKAFDKGDEPLAKLLNQKPTNGT
jgi:membrane fusion protein (multidrug efflux system)